MWDGHGNVKLVTPVSVMDVQWEVRYSLHRRESLWAAEQAVMIDAVPPDILFTFSPPASFLSLCSVG